MIINNARPGQRGNQMRRREFVTLLAGSATTIALSRAGHAKQALMRRVGILLGWDENNPSAKLLLSKLTQRLRELGWREESNIRLDVRWAAGNVDRMQFLAKELVGLGPDLIVACTTPATAALHRETRTLPIVFVTVSDPIGAGFVASLSRPGANITGFINLEPTMGGKWLELLKEIAPRVMRVAIMFNPDTAPSGGSYFLPSFEAAALSVGVTAVTAPVRSEVDIETAIAMLGRADVIQRVNGSIGPPAGIILWELKRTKNWIESWLPKLREDQRRCNADIALVVSKALPKQVETFDFVEGDGSRTPDAHSL